VPEIPFLVRWGGVLWPVLLVPLAVVGAIAASRLRRRLDRARIANAVAAAATVGEHPASVMQAGLVASPVSPRVRIEFIVLGFLAGGLLGLFALRIAAAAALEPWSRDADAMATPAGCAGERRSGFGIDDFRLAIASLSPFHRTTAFRTLEYRLRQSAAWCPHDDALLDRLVEVADLAGSCAADVLLDHRKYAFAAETGEACADSGGGVPAAAARMALGRVDLASRDLERADPWLLGAAPEFVVATHLLAGRIDVAAREARRLATVVHRRQPWRRPLAETLACVADALEARRGNRAALQSLSDAADDEPSRTCSELLDWALAPLNPVEPVADDSRRPDVPAPPESDLEDCCWHCPAFRPEPCVRRQRTAAEASGDRAAVDRLDRILATYDRARADESIAFPLEMLSRTGTPR
jgi:hypothetical protein